MSFAEITLTKIASDGDFGDFPTSNFATSLTESTADSNVILRGTRVREGIQDDTLSVISIFRTVTRNFPILACTFTIGVSVLTRYISIKDRKNEEQFYFYGAFLLS